MAKVKRIRHPQPDEHVAANFVAHGTAEKRGKNDPGKITGTLVDANGNEIDGTTIHERPNWAILFQNVPPGRYTLQVKFRGDADMQQVSFQVGEHIIGITFPPGDGSVCNTFVAYGTQTFPNNGQVSGTMQRDNYSVDGTTILQPTGRGTWAIQFSNVQGQFRYDLEVSDTSGGSGTNTNILVNNC